MDSAEVLEAVLRSKSGTVGAASATTTVTSTVFENRWGVIRALLKKADCPRVRRTLMSFVEHSRRVEERCEEPEPNNAGGGTSSSSICTDGRTDEGFINSLRAQLLRVRVAGLLRQDFLLTRQLVELKVLCHEACANNDSLRANGFQDLWETLGRREKLAHAQQSNHDLFGSSLAADAAIISKAREILQPVDSKDSSKNGPCTDDSFRNQADAPQCHRPAIQDPADALPLLALAEALGATTAVDACLDFIATAQEAVVNAAQGWFGVGVDWERAVIQLAAWPRTSRQSPSPPESPCLKPQPSPSPPRAFNRTQRAEIPGEHGKPHPVVEELRESQFENFRRRGRYCATSEQGRQKGTVRGSRSSSYRSGRDEVGNNEVASPCHVIEGGRNHRGTGMTQDARAEWSTVVTDVATQHQRTEELSSRSWPGCEESPHPRMSTFVAPRTVPPLAPPAPPTPHRSLLSRVTCGQSAKRVGENSPTLDGSRVSRESTCGHGSATEDESCRCRHEEGATFLFPMLGKLEAEGSIQDCLDSDDDRLVSEDGDRDTSLTPGASPADLRSVAPTDKPRSGKRDPIEGRLDSSIKDVCLCNHHTTAEASTKSMHTLPRKTDRAPTVRMSPFPLESRWQRRQSNSPSDTMTCRHHRVRERAVCQPSQSADVSRLPPQLRTSSEGLPKSSADLTAMLATRDDDISCALARKRALLRVRLARQQGQLAVAEANANEQGFRAQRRKKREDKVAALLVKTSGSAVHCNHHMNRRSGAVRSFGDEGDDEREILPMEAQGTGVHRAEPRPKNGVPFMAPSPPWVAQHGSPDPHSVRGGAAREKSPPSTIDRHQGTPVRDNCCEEDEAPRQPLKIYPAAPDTIGWKARRMRDGIVGETFIASMGQATSVKRSADCRSCGSFSGPAAPSPLVVRLDTLYSLPGRGAHFNGRFRSDTGASFSYDDTSDSAGVYLVLEAGRLRHETAVQRPDSYCRHGMCRTTEGGTRWVTKRGKDRADPVVAGAAWVFSETVVLHPKAEQSATEQAFLVDSLRVLVYSEGRSSGDESSPQRYRLAGERARQVAASGILVGEASLPLRIGMPVEDPSRRASECTFSRPVEVTVVSANDSTVIGWLGIGVCGMTSTPS